MNSREEDTNQYKNPPGKTKLLQKVIGYFTFAHNFSMQSKITHPHAVS